MSVVATRLDGQNIGLRLTGGSLTAPLISVNLTTGAVSSPYCTQPDLQNLRAGALTLFQLVPVGERATVAFLSRLIAVAPADASVISLSASVVGSLATLVVTVAATPANLVLHLPFLPEGGLAWAATSSGGGVVTGVTASAPLASTGGATPNLSLAGYTAYTAPGTGTFAAGNVLTLNTAGVLVKASSAPGGFRNVLGISVDGDSSPNPRVMTTEGTIIEILFDVAPTMLNVGQWVYLSRTVPGLGSMTAPTLPGRRVYKLGVLNSATVGPLGGYSVSYSPQFIIDL